MTQNCNNAPDDRNDHCKHFQVNEKRYTYEIFERPFVTCHDYVYCMWQQVWRVDLVYSENSVYLIDRSANPS
jgi:hypothetical protein